LHQVIHIIHIKKEKKCGLLLRKKEQTFCSEMIKIDFCRKIFKKRLTFKKSKYSKKWKNNSDNLTDSLKMGEVVV